LGFKKLIIAIFSFVLLFTLSLNFMQGPMPEDSHAHHEHDLLVHFHQHTHMENIHSHYHGGSAFVLLDFFCSSLENINFSKIKTNKTAFDLSELFPKELIEKLFKPPKII
jgi:hypothetical protein